MTAPRAIDATLLNPPNPDGQDASNEPDVLDQKTNYPQLKWKYPLKGSNAQHDRKKESLQHLQKISSSVSRTKPLQNYKFYKYENRAVQNMPNLRGHSLSDVGDDIIVIGGHQKCDRIDVYRLNKSMSRVQKIDDSIKGAAPCCRFDHRAQFIRPLNAIFFFGGFDTQCNFNDARLLFLDTMRWYELEENAASWILYRAYHACASRVVDDGVNRKWECYVFGGQYCSGGRYLYHDDLYRFTFYDKAYVPSDSDSDDGGDDEKHSPSNEEKNVGFFKSEKIERIRHNASETPCARSQSYMWIKQNVLYVYGGSYATDTTVHALNDLWTLDLHTQLWSKLEYEGILNAPPTHSVAAKPYRVPMAPKPCYYDAVSDQLIVIHFQALDHVQQAFLQSSDDTLDEFEARKKNGLVEAKDNENEQGNGNGKGKRGVLGQLQQALAKKPTIFVFDMASKKWIIERSRNLSIVQDEYDVLPRDIGNTRVIRLGEFMAFLGGGTRGSGTNYMQQVHMLKIPKYRGIKSMSWSRERLLWIGHCQTSDDPREVSILSRCSKDVMMEIISFLNPKPKAC